MNIVDDRNDSNYRKAEAMLYNYHKTEAEIKNLQIDMDNLMEYDVLPAASNAVRPGSPTYAITSKVENEVIRRDEKQMHHIKVINRKIKFLKGRLQKIDNALEAMSDEQRKIVKMRYFEGMSVERISQEMHMHPATLNRKRKEIINNYIIELCLASEKEKREN